MGMLNIDEHVEEHRLIGIKYPEKAVVTSEPNQFGLSVTSIWVGTQAEYDAIAVKDANTEYNVLKDD